MKQRELLYNQIKNDKSQTMAWPLILRNCFSTLHYKQYHTIVSTATTNKEKEKDNENEGRERDTSI